MFKNILSILSEHGARIAFFFNQPRRTSRIWTSRIGAGLGEEETEAGLGEAFWGCGMMWDVQKPRVVCLFCYLSLLYTQLRKFDHDLKHPETIPDAIRARMADLFF